MTIRKTLFPLLVLFAFLTFQISPAYIVAGLLLLFWLIDVGQTRRWSEVFGHPVVGLLGLQALFILLSTIFSRDPVTSASHLAGLSLFLILPIAMDLLDRPQRARVIFLALGASGILLSLVGFWQFVHGGNNLENRIMATLSHWMTYSGLTMIAGCTLLGLTFEERGKWRGIGMLGLLPLAAMLLTFTRNAYVGALLAVILYLAIRRPRGLVLLVPVLALVFFLSPGPIRARIVSIASLQDITNRDRISMLHAGTRMIADSPLFGIGPEMVRRYYPLYRDPDAAQWHVPHLHNNTLQIAAANGIFAALAYLALMGLFFVRTVQLLRREARPTQAALLAGALMAGVALFAAGFFEYNWGDTEVEMATLLAMAVPFSRATTPRNDGAPPPAK